MSHSMLEIGQWHGRYNRKPLTRHRHDMAHSSSCPGIGAPVHRYADALIAAQGLIANGIVSYRKLMLSSVYSALLLSLTTSCLGLTGPLSKSSGVLWEWEVYY